MGTSATGATLDLNASQDYTDLAFWKPVPATELIPQGLNVDSSDATAVGGIVVLNDARGSANRVHRPGHAECRPGAHGHGTGERHH